MHPITTQPAGVLPSSWNCISVTYNNGQICADFPIVGQQCYTFSGLPHGSGSAQVCATPTSFDPPCATLTVTVGGVQLPGIPVCAP
jgi:hypothetical protein